MPPVHKALHTTPFHRLYMYSTTIYLSRLPQHEPSVYPRALIVASVSTSPRVIHPLHSPTHGSGPIISFQATLLEWAALSTLIFLASIYAPVARTQHITTARKLQWFPASDLPRQPWHVEVEGR